MAVVNLGAHNPAHSLVAYWPLMLLGMTAIGYVMRLIVRQERHTAQLAEHGRVLSEVHDKLDASALVDARIEGKLDGLTGLLGGAYPGGRRFYEQGLLRADRGGMEWERDDT